jgi:hypothetical protein
MFENIGKKIKRIAIVGGILGAFYASQIGFNNLLYNREYISGNYHSVTKPDKAFGHTDFTRHHDGDYRNDEVYQFRFLGPSRVMTDGGMYGENDGLVDRIHIMGLRFGGVTGVLNREENYERFKDEFDNADRVLAETKERFAEYFK